MNLCYVCGREFNMPLSFSIRLEPDFSSAFSQHVVSEIQAKLKRNVTALNTSIKARVKDTFMELLFNSPEVTSLTRGALQGNLGVTDPEGKIINIVDTWMNNIHVSVQAGNSPLLTVNIGILTEDYSDVLSLPDSSHVSDNGHIIEWLRWLLLEGDKTIANYFFLPGRRSKSRTGRGIMVQKEGRVWSIPPQFRGTATDNFATRALENLDKALDRIVRVEINKVFK